MPHPPIALTIAGSDSGAGAGIQADLKTYYAFGVYGTTVLTAVTAQNTVGVSDVLPIPVETVRSQLHAVIEDLRPEAFKSGMLANATLVEAIADDIASYELSNYVLDPVMVATSGDRLLDRDAERTVASRLLPLATLVTPNLAEARILADMEIESVEDMSTATDRLIEMGAEAALVKGGHLPADGDVGGTVTDVLNVRGKVRSWTRPRFPTKNTHGTGCTLSAAVAAGLARGAPLATAVDRAISYVARAIESAPSLGRGHGPINHFVSGE